MSVFGSMDGPALAKSRAQLERLSPNCGVITPYDVAVCQSGDRYGLCAKDVPCGLDCEWVVDG